MEVNDLCRETYKSERHEAPACPTYGEFLFRFGQNLIELRNRFYVSDSHSGVLNQRLLDVGVWPGETSNSRRNLGLHRTTLMMSCLSSRASLPTFSVMRPGSVGSYIRNW